MKINNVSLLLGNLSILDNQGLKDYDQDKFLNLVQTCGLCETICDQADIASHGCLKGYKQYTTDPDTLYFYPLLDDRATEIKSRVLSRNKEQIVTTQSHKKNTNFVKPEIGQKRKLSEQYWFNSKAFYDKFVLLVIR